MARHKEPPIWLLVLGLVFAAGTIAVLRLGNIEAFGPTPWWIWPVTVLGFVAAESIVVRVHFRSEGTAFTFIELPLFLAALYVAPSAVWSAMVIGVAISMFAVQRVPLMKGTFNVANTALQGAVGLWMFHSLVDGANPLGPQGWASAALAALVSSSLGAVAIILAILLVGGRSAIKGVGHTAFMGACTALTNVSLALVGASLIDYRPTALALLVLPTFVLYGSYRAYTSERAQRDRVQAMHELALEVRSIRDESALPAVLRLAADRLGAQRADLVLFPDHRAGGQATRFVVDRNTEEVSEVVSSDLASVLDNVHALGASEKRTSATGESQIACAIRGEERALGLLMFEGRLHESHQFAADDLAMLTTIAEQLGLTLEKNQLGHAVTQLERRGIELQHVANHDALTGLANRALLASTLEEELKCNRSPSLLYVDLDDFKDVNDQYGHDAGDEVLIKIAARFANAVGPQDCVARLGGDEFAVLLGEYSDDVGVATSLLAAAAAPIVISHGVVVRVNASIGIARAARGADVSSLLKRADGAMYTAKENGKGKLALADS